MSINACTMDISSMDTFCGARRAIVLNALIHEFRPPQPPSTGKASNGGWAKNRPPPKFAGIHRPRWDQDDAPPYVPTELDHVTVSATVFGQTGVVMQKIEQRLDLVTVTDVHSNPEEIKVTAEMVDVNIENFKVHHV